MTNKTRNILHRCYVEAVKNGIHAICDTDILRLFITQLENAIPKIPQKDSQKFFSFFEGVKTSLKKREKKKQVRDFILKWIKVSELIQDWLNDTLCICSNQLYRVREKPLESEFTKLYIKASEHRRCVVRDRNSIYIIFKDNDLNKMYTVHNYLVGILTGLDQKARMMFIEWVEQNYPSHIFRDVQSFFEQSISLDTKGMMHDTENFSISENLELDIPKKSGSDYLDWFKDYFVTPKMTSYQGLQGVFVVEDLNIYIECIFQTAKSYHNNLYGKASHSKHKTSEVEKASTDSGKAIFNFRKSELELLSMELFHGYDFPKTDLLGIHNAEWYYSDPHVYPLHHQ